ncbi:hypothetical protein BS78_K152300 [Paspalum vaginatum]|uniref:Uncharacterized protein n=1 Tax=Paspalum vaginatum TaxID=158149 RepID=A0A9W7X7U4_9POAL|nr:hypothetical protein BS78_K152300 [Paspalum vaginatum]
MPRRRTTPPNRPVPSTAPPALSPINGPPPPRCHPTPPHHAMATLPASPRRRTLRPPSQNPIPPPPSRPNSDRYCHCLATPTLPSHSTRPKPILGAPTPCAPLTPVRVRDTMWPPLVWRRCLRRCGPPVPWCCENTAANHVPPQHHPPCQPPRRSRPKRGGPPMSCHPWTPPCNPQSTPRIPLPVAPPSPGR